MYHLKFAKEKHINKIPTMTDAEAVTQERITCKVCNEGNLFKKKLPKYGSVWVAIGWTIIGLSILGVVAAFIFGLITLGTGFLPIFIPSIIGLVVGFVLIGKKKGLQCENCEATVELP